ncbi:unnamed protein product [Acanthoscelides obtectus]|uniref:Uncharacterized protein n=1 Tax=Acanthoscelides obtectus TaxID=200917 RepID=A0A9P0P554_ACAOB|nr:unnamed protein product [Acanthoscelides obtectus]CAK1654258.1 hypothetical protein AOBTE_LOCUS18495 [Acanthoscelides obtectus]
MIIYSINLKISVCRVSDIRLDVLDLQRKLYARVKQHGIL